MYNWDQKQTFHRGGQGPSAEGSVVPRSKAPHTGGAGLRPQTFIPHGSGGQKSKVKVGAGLAPPEASLRGLHSAAFSRSLHVAFPCVCVPDVPLRVQISPS